jgi:hypothetical protein
LAYIRIRSKRGKIVLKKQKKKFRFRSAGYYLWGLEASSIVKSRDPSGFGFIKISVADLDPAPDPHVSGSPGSLYH